MDFVPSDTIRICIHFKTGLKIIIVGAWNMSAERHWEKLLFSWLNLCGGKTAAWPVSYKTFGL